MFRIDSDGNDNGKFTGGDPLLPTPATVVSAAWLNAVQEELAGTVVGLGGVLDKANSGQLLERLNARYGRLDMANTWAGAQSITGNLSLGGSLSVTASTTLAGPLTANGVSTFNAAATFTTNGTNAAAVTATGNGTGAGVKGTGGNANGHGLEGVGGTGGRGVQGKGSAGNEGVRAIAGTAATAATAYNALGVVDGYIGFGAVNPNSNVAFTNTLAPANIPKAWVTFTPKSTGPVVDDGFNVTSVVNDGADAVLITFASPFLNNAYACSYDTNTHDYTPRSTTKTTTTLRVVAKDNAGSLKSIGSNMAGGVVLQLSVMIVGKQ
jgi:hypothetical protein